MAKRNDVDLHSTRTDYYEDYCKDSSLAVEKDIERFSKLTDEEKQEMFRAIMQAATAALERISKAGFNSIAEYEATILNRKFSFPAVKARLQQIASIDEKLKFLHLLLADYKRESRGIEKGDPQPFNVKRSDGTVGFLFNVVPMGNHLVDGFWTFKEDVEIEIEKLEKLKNLSGEYRAKDEYDPKKRGLTKQLAMLLLDELFPNLKNSSNTAKAAFLYLITGFSADALRNKWSDYRRGSPEAFADDMAKVAEWRQKLKISDC